MSKKYKLLWKAYTAWSYQKEIDDLNKKSQEGWQLIKGGCFCSKFKKNPDLCYRHQIDYPGKIEDMGRYIEIFREQGWEYVNSTFNGWNYFRKPYDSTLPEKEYEILTDRQSMREMTGRWQKLAIVFSIIFALLTILFTVAYVLTPKLPLLIDAVIYLIATLYFLRGIFLMKNPEKGRKKRREGLFLSLFIIFWIIGNLSVLLLTGLRPDLVSSYTSDNTAPITEEAIEWMDFSVPYKDNYYMSLVISNDFPACLSIVDENGEVVYEIQGANVDKEDIRLNLCKGNYRILLSDFSGGKLSINFEMN